MADKHVKPAKDGAKPLRMFLTGKTFRRSPRRSKIPLRIFSSGKTLLTARNS
jgi:hypothetical protein